MLPLADREKAWPSKNHSILSVLEDGGCLADLQIVAVVYRHGILYITIKLFYTVYIVQGPDREF